MHGEGRSQSALLAFLQSSCNLLGLVLDRFWLEHCVQPVSGVGTLIGLAASLSSDGLEQLEAAAELLGQLLAAALLSLS